MRRRSPARWLAPLALVTCAVAIYTVVDRELLSDSSKSGTTTTTTRTTRTSTTAKKKKAAAPRTYTVKAGDVLSAIAEKTGTTVPDLLRLNPSVDASSLRPGQKLRLSR